MQVGDFVRLKNNLPGTSFGEGHIVEIVGLDMHGYSVVGKEFDENHSTMTWGVFFSDVEPATALSSFVELFI